MNRAREWFNLTAQVDRAGVYSANLLYTSNRGGTISIDVNGKTATPPLTIASTFNASDPIVWRQWHHWNILRGLVSFAFPQEPVFSQFIFFQEEI
jgi:hypothetical protein